MRGRTRRLLAGCLGVAALVAGAVVGVSSAHAAPSQNEPTVIKDIAYAPAEPATSKGHLLDLYIPGKAKPGKGKIPLLIWTGGSGWLGDNGKATASKPAEYFAANGWAVAGVSVRSSFQTKFPGQVHDIKSAIRWLRHHADEYGIDPDRFAIMGDSSGGWVSQMAAYTSDVPELEGDLGITGVSSEVQAVVDIYGPTDFLQMDANMLPGACEEFNRNFGTVNCHTGSDSPESRLVGCGITECPELVARANPITYVDENDPETLIIHGQADKLVPHNQSELLYAALADACINTTFHSLPQVGHQYDFANDAGLATGQTVKTVKRCHKEKTVKNPAAPTWEYIADFLKHNIRK